MRSLESRSLDGLVKPLGKGSYKFLVIAQAILHVVQYGVGKLMPKGFAPLVFVIPVATHILLGYVNAVVCSIKATPACLFVYP
jgi:hypothetical protein